MKENAYKKALLFSQICLSIAISLLINSATSSMAQQYHDGSGAAAIGGDVGRAGYTGTPMTMDFVDADVTNILRLIGEVSDLNIIWGPEVKGRVFMRLKNVPWDQALDLILANNDLAMRRDGNVVWVMTRSKLAQIHAQEKKRREDAEAERKRRIEEAKEAREIEPLITEYIPLDFAKADRIKEHIILSERGKIRVDERTNTIIIRDIAQSIEDAQKIIKRFDTPVKQIMIEARIVDASTDFSRHLGVEWTSERKRRKRTGIDWDNKPTDFAESGDYIAGGTFATNSPKGWEGNIGLSFARLAHRGLSTLTLDASLALAETEGKVKIISAPKVIASNGEQAEISRGEVFYLDAAENVEAKEVEASLSLKVTPTVSFNDYVTMEIEVRDDKALPDKKKQKKRIKTKLMVKSGETIVIGGIYKEDKFESEKGIPWLRNIPVLGWLFKARRKTSERTELLIFLTPRVIQTSTT